MKGVTLDGSTILQWMVPHEYMDSTVGLDGLFFKKERRRKRTGKMGVDLGRIREE